MDLHTYRNYAYAREHIEQLPSVSSNRLQESILAQLEAFENGIDAMDEAVTKNLQNFVRELTRKICTQWRLFHGRNLCVQ